MTFFNSRFFASVLGSLTERIAETRQSTATAAARIAERYRTRDAGQTFHFGFEEQEDGDWRVYINRPVDYGPRDTDLHSTHRYRDGDRHFICWSTPLHSLENARKVAAAWAERTRRYIQDGTPF